MWREMIVNSATQIWRYYDSEIFPTSCSHLSTSRRCSSRIFLRGGKSENAQQLPMLIIACVRERNYRRKI